MTKIAKVTRILRIDGLYCAGYGGRSPMRTDAAVPGAMPGDVAVNG